MKKTILLLTVFVFMQKVELKAQTRNEIRTLYTKSYQAYQSGDYENAMKANQSVLEITPCNPIIVYNISCMHALLDDTAKAFQWLNRYVDMGAGFNLDLKNEPDFEDIKDSPSFKKILLAVENKRKPINNCKEAFRILEKDLLPEGIAYYPKEKAFYLGSTYKSKIIMIDRNGKISDFTKEKQDGLRSILGMKVDVKENILWVNSNITGPRIKDYNPEELGMANVFKYNLKTGELIKKYVLYEEGIRHIFNDLIIAQNGDVYITDTNTGSIYKISSNKDSLELFFSSDKLMYPNGITISPDGKYLYIADSGNQLYILDIKTKECNVLKIPDNLTTYGTDGIYYYKNSLIAIQNQLQKLSRFYLDESGKNITSCDIIESNNPLFAQFPTTGVLVKDQFYFIANSQTRSFNRDNTIFLNEQLTESVILKYSLSD